MSHTKYDLTKSKRPLKIFICSNACERRNLDANKVRTYFLRNNYSLVNHPRDADYILFFTCASADKTTKICLRRIKQLNNYDAELIVAGCLPDIAGDRLREIFNGRIVTTKDIDKIDEIFGDIKIRFDDIEDEHLKWLDLKAIGPLEELLYFSKKTFKKIPFTLKIYSFIKKHIFKKFFGETFPFPMYSPKNLGYIISISRGCIHNCSYCAIIKAIGPLKSKPIEQCIKEFKSGLDKGYTKFILQGDDIGPYGIDIGTTLPRLLDEMTKIKGDYSIDIRGTHPDWIIKYTDDFKELLKRQKIRYILLGIQSGNNRILNLMRRSYSREEILQTISKFKESYSDLDIGTQLIVGFPSETNEEFKETLELTREVLFSNGLIYSFFSVDGTGASEMETQMTERELRRRMKVALNFLKKSNYHAGYSRIYKTITFRSK